MEIKINNIPQPTESIQNSQIQQFHSNDLPNANVLDNFQHPPSTNPLRGLRFDAPIHKAITKHFSQSHVSPFSNVQMESGYAQMFHFQYFVSLLTAARLEPGNKISGAYVRQRGNQLHILATYGKEYASMHSHYMVFRNPSGSKRPEVNDFAIADQELAALGWHMLPDGVDVHAIESHEYELVPRRTSVEERMGIEMRLAKSKKHSMKFNFSPDDADFASFQSQPEKRLLKYFYNEVRRTTNEPKIGDLNMLAQNALLQMPRPPTPETETAHTAGYLHGLLSSALPDKYYRRMIDASSPAIHYNSEGIQLYFPATLEMPNEHLLLDINPNNINKHIGYDVFNQLAPVSHETKIIETRFTDNHLSLDRLDPLSSRTLKWSIENIAENLHLDILNARPSDARILKQNIEYYSEISKNILSHENIKCNLRSLADLKAFLIGKSRGNSDEVVRISKSNEQNVDALLVVTYMLKH